MTMMYTLIIILVAYQFSLGFSFRPPLYSQFRRAKSSLKNTDSGSDYDTISSASAVLSRDEGFFFDLGTGGRTIRFGSVVTMDITADGVDDHAIEKFVADPQKVAKSVWEEERMTLLECSEGGGGESFVYRLELMPLEFVSSIKLQPTVDMKMFSKQLKSNKKQFMMESVSFSPNLHLFGSDFTADSLQIQIKVAGVQKLSPIANSTIVGRVGFEVLGNLAGPLRIMPKTILSQASKVICNKITTELRTNFQTNSLRELARYGNND